MTAKEMKIKTFSLIEEYYPDNTLLADDSDVQYKINGVINGVMLDLLKYRKIPAKYTVTVKAEEPIILLKTIPNIYQLNKINTDVDYEFLGNYEIKFDIEEDTDVDIYYYKYPTLMELTFESDTESASYDENYEFEVETDLLEAMPYGIASDLLKNDMISGYGKYFYERYTELKNTIDSRYTTGVISITGGVDI